MVEIEFDDVVLKTDPPIEVDCDGYRVKCYSKEGGKLLGARGVVEMDVGERIGYMMKGADVNAKELLMAIREPEKFKAEADETQNVQLYSMSEITEE